MKFSMILSVPVFPVERLVKRRNQYNYIGFPAKILATNRKSRMSLDIRLFGAGDRT